MPEMPEMQALSERLGQAVVGARLQHIEQLGFTGLKTVQPAPQALLGLQVLHVGRRAKYLVIEFENQLRLLIHLAQAGRIDVEHPAKSTKPRGAVVRLVFDNDLAILVREHGSERKARWWILSPGDDGPLAELGPEATESALSDLIFGTSDTRRLHTFLRDQSTVAGIGRGYADDILHRARLSPFSSLDSLNDVQRRELIAAINEVLDSALQSERTRDGGLSAPRLGERFVVHNRAGQACPRCGEGLARVSYDAYEIVYCPRCQTKGKVLADRRLSRLLR